MTDAEKHLLIALCRMCDQYLRNGESLDHMFMRAGEDAIGILVQHGLVSPGPRGGVWTQAGQALLNAR